jgi:hypothetical protein
VYRVLRRRLTPLAFTVRPGSFSNMWSEILNVSRCFAIHLVKCFRTVAQDRSLRPIIPRGYPPPRPDKPLSALGD